MAKKTRTTSKTVTYKYNVPHTGILPTYKCKYCGHVWTPRTDRPVQCPSCHRTKWWRIAQTVRLSQYKQVTYKMKSVFTSNPLGMIKKPRQAKPQVQKSRPEYITEDDETTSTSTKRKKNPYAVKLGKLGGKASTAARMQKISASERSEIAKHAADVRWKNKPRTRKYKNRP